MIVGITESRLAQVAYDFNVQITKADQTLGKLVTEKPVDFVGFDNVVEFNKKSTE